MSDLRHFRPAARGFTLVEIMVSTLLISVLMLAAGTVMGLGARTAHQHELISDARDSSILAERAISIALHNAGFGAAGGIITPYSGGFTAGVMMPVFSYNRSAAADDLYVITADPNAALEDCSATATSARIMGGAGGLQLSCTTGLQNGDSVVAYNPTTTQPQGKLLTNIRVSGPLIVSYSELANTGFAPADLIADKRTTVAKVKILHFYIANNPATGRSALWQENMVPATPGPLVAVNQTQRVVSDGIEDLQVTGECDSNATCSSGVSGDPTGYSEVWYATFAFNGYPLRSIPYQPFTNLRAVQVSLSALTKPFRNSDNSLLVGTGPVSLQDHVVSATPTNDGMKRLVVEERVDLPNLGVASLNMPP